MLKDDSSNRLLATTPHIAEIDRAIADQITAGCTPSAAAHAFISHMSHALRQGHLCVTADAPRPSELGRLKEDELEWSEVEWHKWDAFVRQGAAELSDALIGHTILKDRGRYYFQRFWNEEGRLLHNCRRLLDCSSSLVIDRSKLSTLVDDNTSLLPEQKRAIMMAVDRPLSLLAGGPGTGKTYTVGMLLRGLWDCMDDAQRKTFRVAIAAPTGKAASQLQRSLSRSLCDTSWEERLTAQTLHTLLGINPFWRDQRPRIAADIVIVDESSMVDASLMSLLLRSIPSGSHLLLVGDPHQLPAVEVGSVFADLIQGLQPQGCYTELKVCLRAELKGILSLAEGVKAGDVGRVTAAIDEQGVAFEECAFQYSAQETLVQKYADRYAYGSDPAEALAMQQQFRILTPLRRGLFGVERLNALFADRLRAHIVPIIITGNSPDIELFNGELGILVGGETGYFYDRTGAIRSLPRALLPKHELAYCLSVHKSQGSEFDEVALLLPPRSEGFGRQLLYTGITRAKRQVVLWGEQQRLSQLVLHCPKRISGLVERLQSESYSKGTTQ